MSRISSTANFKLLVDNINFKDTLHAVVLCVLAVCQNSWMSKRGCPRYAYKAIQEPKLIHSFHKSTLQDHPFMFFLLLFLSPSSLSYKGWCSVYLSIYLYTRQSGKEEKKMLTVIKMRQWRRWSWCWRRRRGSRGVMACTFRIMNNLFPCDVEFRAEHTVTPADSFCFHFTLLLVVVVVVIIICEFVF